VHLVQILLPLYDNEGQPFGKAEYDRVAGQLSERFGGVTAFIRSPARGLWKESNGDSVRDDVVVYEVMIDELDRVWWVRYREELRAAFRQDQLILRALEVELL
jgi:hypothetical protein